MGTHQAALTPTMQVARNAETEVELSIVSPLFNEAEIIERTLDNFIEVMDSFPAKWELILVNDGSTDNSLELIEKYAKKDGRIRICTYSVNRGRGYALRTGFSNSSGHYVISSEADLSWGADIIQRLYVALKETGADIVVASPYSEGGRLENVPLNRVLLSKFGNKILKWAAPDGITMLSGMTRGYKGNIIRQLTPAFEEDRKEIHLEIISKMRMLGMKFYEIPAVLRWEPSKKGKRKRKSKFDAVKLIKTHLYFSFSEAPILLFGSIGSVMLVIGFIMGFYLSYLYFIEGQVVGDRVVLILTTVFLIVVGLQIFLFCFLAYRVKDLKKELFRAAFKRWL